MESAGAGKDLTAVEVRHQPSTPASPVELCFGARSLTRVCWAES